MYISILFEVLLELYVGFCSFTSNESGEINYVQVYKHTNMIDADQCMPKAHTSAKVLLLGRA